MVNIMVVEDDLLQAMDLQDALQDRGHRVCGVANSGEQAVTLAKARRPDVVVIDVRLNGRIDGVAAAKQIVSKRRCGLVFVTAHGDDKAVANRMDDLVPDAVLLKPVNHRALCAAIDLIAAQSKAN